MEHCGRRFAVVVAEGELVYVLLKMLAGNAGVRGLDTALQVRPEALDCVCVNVTAHPFTGLMVHPVMLEAVTRERLVARSAVG